MSAKHIHRGLPYGPAHDRCGPLISDYLSSPCSFKPFLAAAEQQILNAGGSISGQGAARTYRLPDADDVDAPSERPDPTGPVGLVGEVRRAGGVVTASASVERAYDTDRWDLDGITDGIVDVSYNGRLPCWTKDSTAAQPAGGDYYQLDFDRDVIFASVVFHEGDIGLANSNSNPRVDLPRGGYFTDLTVEVGHNGVFVAVANLQFGEPLDPYEYFQVIELAFQPVVGSAIRIRGTAGGTLEYTTIVELEAFGRLGAIHPGDATLDDVVDVGDLGVMAAHYGQDGRAWIHGDFNGDGSVDVGDLGILAAQYGWSSAPAGSAPRTVPEPASVASIGAALLAALARRKDRWRRGRSARIP